MYKTCTFEDFKTFLIFLEVFGTGRAIQPNGHYVELKYRRKNSIKKIDLIITDLILLFKTDFVTNVGNKEFLEKIRKLSLLIIKGFK
jgi:hypothetical protein